MQQPLRRHQSIFHPFNSAEIQSILLNNKNYQKTCILKQYKAIPLTNHTT